MKRSFILMGIILIAFLAVGGMRAINVNAQAYTFNNDLAVGSNGPDVTQLQTWLINNGFSIPAIASGITGKGYFGSQTQAALMAYQRSSGLPAYGFFGPMTRQYFNNRGGNNDNNDNSTASIRVTSPNGGEVWQKGTTQNITWTGSAAFLNQTADIRLEFPVPACALPTNPVRCMIATQAPLTIAKGVNLSSGSYAWYVGNQSSFSCIPEAGTCTFPDGQYKVQICPTNGSQCDDSDNYFTISTGGTTNSIKPTISGIDAPTSLAVGQVGTWTIHATDPLNGTLSYSILWGDEPGYNVTAGTMMTPSVMQTSTFQHSYVNAGVYTVTFMVKNSSGGMVQTSSTVTVGGTNTAGPLKIVSPNGGEIWQKGTTQYITWTSPSYFRTTYVEIKLQPSNACTGQVCMQVFRMPYTIASNISVNQNSYSWNVGQVLGNSDSFGIPVVGFSTAPDGQYTIQICEMGTSNCTSSSNLFMITSNQTVGLSDINVVSPNGGEVWYVGNNQQVSFNISGDSSRIGNNVTAYLVDTKNQQIYVGTFSQGISVGQKAFYITVPSNLISGSYKLLVNLNYGSQQQAYDYSDNYFTESNTCPAGYTCTSLARPL
jgi:hypothetical protein